MTDEAITSPSDSPPAEAWSVSSGFDAPESACFDPLSKFIFVSNVAGDPAAKNGKGWISKLDTSGKVIAAQWVSGLKAPKGMRTYKNTLWVSGVDELVGIDIPSGQISNRIKIDGAKFLNDMAIDNDGNLFVSDTFGNKIYKLADGKPSVLAEGDELEHPHGLLVHDDLLIVASIGDTVPDPSNSQSENASDAKSPGHLYSINLATKKKERVAPQLFGTLSGVELDGSGGYYVSDFAAGKVYRATSDGAVTLLLEGFKGAADIGIVDSDQLLVVPRMLENKVTAYKLGS
jgi:hypothetical protein